MFVPELNHSDLTASQRAFVARTDRALRECADPAILHVYADGTRSPNGEKFVAELLDMSFHVVFDFGVGRLYRTSVQLPLMWRYDFARQHKAA